MAKASKGEGTKIAQAAKDLGVTSVTIRRYVAEFNIETTSDENGIKVLPERAMEELHEVRRLKDDGLTNAQVLEQLEELRSKGGKAEKKKPAAKRVAAEPPKKEARKPERKASRKTEEVVEAEEEEEAEDEEEEVAAAPTKRTAAPAAEGEEEGAAVEGDGRSKHTLTCQTCSKTFEHMNPRLRDCLECYRAKRKERRRDKHKNVIQHPLAAQVTSKQQRQSQSEPMEPLDLEPVGRERGDRGERGERGERGDRGERDMPAASPLPMSAKRVNPLAGTHKTTVRNYRKAIEETRGITANLKRRLERPDLPENERRWLEQIYAYQLILHQGWRHLAEYKAGTPAGSNRESRSEAPPQKPEV